jgi:hypothetical protein
MSITYNSRVQLGCLPPFFGWALLIAGIFFMSIALFKDTKLALLGKRTDGVVESLSPVSNSTMLKVRYTPEGGQPVTFETTSTFGVELKPGDAIGVVYLKHKPQAAEINTARQLWLPLLIALSFSTACLVSGAFIIRYHRMLREIP